MINLKEGLKRDNVDVLMTFFGTTAAGIFLFSESVRERGGQREIASRQINV